MLTYVEISVADARVCAQRCISLCPTQDTVALTHDPYECFTGLEILSLSDGDVLHGDGTAFLVEDACLDEDGQRKSQST